MMDVKYQPKRESRHSSMISNTSNGNAKSTSSAAAEGKSENFMKILATSEGMQNYFRNIYEQRLATTTTPNLAQTPPQQPKPEIKAPTEAAKITPAPGERRERVGRERQGHDYSFSENSFHLSQSNLEELSKAMEELTCCELNSANSCEKLVYPNSEENSAYWEKFMMGEQTPKLKTEYEWRKGHVVKDEIDQKLRTTQELESAITKKKESDEIEKLKQELEQRKAEMEKIKFENEKIKYQYLMEKQQFEMKNSENKANKVLKKSELSNLLQQRGLAQLYNLREGENNKKKQKANKTEVFNQNQEDKMVLTPKGKHFIIIKSEEFNENKENDINYGNKPRAQKQTAKTNMRYSTNNNENSENDSFSSSNSKYPVELLRKMHSNPSERRHTNSYNPQEVSNYYPDSSNSYLEEEDTADKNSNPFKKKSGVDVNGVKGFSLKDVLGAAKETNSLKQRNQKLNSFLEEYESNSLHSSRSFTKIDRRLPRNGNECFSCSKEGNCSVF